MPASLLTFRLHPEQLHLHARLEELRAVAPFERDPDAMLDRRGLPERGANSSETIVKSSSMSSTRATPGASRRAARVVMARGFMALVSRWVGSRRALAP
jgi:hypothetical protein